MIQNGFEKKQEELSGKIEELDISLSREHLIEFCEKAVLMPSFQDLVFSLDSNRIELFQKGYSEKLTIPLKTEKIQLDKSYFNENFPLTLYLMLEGLACVFSGTYAVTYAEGDKKKKCKVSIVDGLYTHCGERCLVRSITFPKIDILEK